MSDYQGNIIVKNPAAPTGPAENGSAPGIWKLSEALAFKRQGIWPTQGVQGADPYFNYVSLLLSTTSLSNANNNLFVDSSGAFNPISRNGNTTQGSATPYSANWSNYFDGSGDYLTVPSNAAFDFGTGDFTIEGWISLNSTSSVVTIVTNYVSGGSAGWSLQYRSDIGGFRFGWGDTALLDYVTSVSRNTWYHLAVTRSGTSLRMFLNGVQVASATNSTSLTGGTTLSVGALNSGGYIQNYNGYISNLRIVKGTAVYTSAFTPPTSALTAISGTSLLTCQSNRFRDASSNNFTITRNGDTRVTDYSPFSPGSPGITYNQSDITNWSGYFDGSGDWLDAPSSSSLGLSTGSFTVEGWIYPTSTASNALFWGSTTSGALFIRLGQYGGTAYSGIQIGRIGVANDTFSAFSFTAGQWYHIAVVRNGSTMTIYVNGTSINSFSNTTDYGSSATARIGATESGGENYAGYISNLRVVKGTAVYTGAFTPPTTNLTAISGTSLLTLQNAAFTDNSTNNFVITPNGNTTVTGNSPFNTTGFWSNYFDGSSTFSFSSISLAADFTIEAWVYYTSTSGNPTLLGENPPNNQSLRRLSGKHYFYRQGASITGTIDIPTNQWVHLAATRSGGTVRIFTNGVLDGSGSISGAFSVNCFGGVDTGTDRLTGYASNVRIVDGTALYTATFTVPTSPLTAVSGTTLLTAQNGTFKDNSTNNRTLTRNGSPTVQTFDPFYTSTIASNGGSMYFDGSGDYLAVPNSANLQFGTSNFTVECWFNSNVSTVDTHSTVIGKWGSGFNTTGDWALRSRFSNTNRAAVTLRYSGGWYDITTSINVNDGAWHHLAFVRENSTTLKIYVDGVLGATRTISASDIVGSSATLSIGGPAVSASGEGAITGYVSNARITTGTALYTAAFAPPTSVLTPSANTGLLVNGMNAGIYDATAINDMETVGNAQVRYPSPFAPADYYAGSFDGSGDWLTVPNNTALQFGSGDFTVEFWANVSTSSGFRGIIGKGGAATGWAVFIDNSNYWAFSIDNLNYAGTVTPTYGAWTHVAFTRSGTTFTLYINGTSVRTHTSSSSFTQTEQLVIGAGRDLTIPYTGSISNVRLVKGAVVYTGNFTPPTSPLTAVSGTSLLTCQNKTFIDNSTNAFTITANGNATAGAIGPFTATGGSSLYFDGSGDYLSLPGGPQNYYGSGNFTIEGWFYFNATPSNMPLLGWGNTSYKVIRISTTSINVESDNPSNTSFNVSFNASKTLTTGVWYHIALVRSGNSFTAYVDGVGGTAYTSFTGNVGHASDTMYIGYKGDPTYFNGYIDDLRITNGYARYTTNFTPPTQAFPPF